MSQFNVIQTHSSTESFAVANAVSLNEVFAQVECSDPLATATVLLVESSLRIADGLQHIIIFGAEQS